MNDKQYTIILFRLPDNKLVLQRRTKDAPYGAGLLGIFGGHVEANETPDQCVLREIKEETNLNTDKLGLRSITNFILPASKDFNKDRHFFLYEGNIDDDTFDVYEGDRAEAYTINELKNRDDLTGSARYTFDNIL